MSATQAKIKGPRSKGQDQRAKIKGPRSKGRQSKHKFDLVLTGLRKQRRYLVRLYGREVWLTGCMLELLCTMAAAAGRGTGYIEAAPVAIHRLRRSIDHSEAESAAPLIQNSGLRYRLALPPSAIGLEPTFAELNASGVLAHALAEQLQRRFREL